MVEIQLDSEQTSEVIAAAIGVFNETGCIAAAIEAVLPAYEDGIQIAILQALAAELGGESQ